MDNNDSDTFKNSECLETMNVIIPTIGKHREVNSHATLNSIGLLSCLVAIIVLIILALIQYRFNPRSLTKRRMLKDMTSLQKAEDQLHELQRELDKVKLEHALSVVGSNSSHDDRLTANHSYDEIRTNRNQPTDRNQHQHQHHHHHHQSESTGLQHYNSNIKDTNSGDANDFAGYFESSQSEATFGSSLDYNRVYELEEELRQTREQLNRAETALANKSWAPPHQLQLWLQLTYELELNHYSAKRHAAETQLAAAKEGCEKLKKKRSSFFGSLRVAHGSSIDDVDNRILQAKQALSEITKELKERLYRWQQIENLCGFAIAHNHGIARIQAELFANHKTSGGGGGGSGVELPLPMMETFMADKETEVLALSRSPVVPRYTSNQRSFRSNHSSDHRSSLHTSSTSSSYHHQPQQLSHSHNYLQAQLSRTEPNNHQHESSGDSESSGSDLDATSHHHQHHNQQQQQSQLNYQTSINPRHEKVVFTLGEGVLDPESSGLAHESSIKANHRRTWSSIRRAPRRSLKKERKTTEIAKSYSLNTVDAKSCSDPDQQVADHKRHNDASTEYPRSSLKDDTTDQIRKKIAIQDTEDFSDDKPESDDDDSIDTTLNPMVESKEVETKLEGDSIKSTAADSSCSAVSKHHSLSFVFKGARKSFNFMSQKRKRSSTTDTSESQSSKNQTD